MVTVTFVPTTTTGEFVTTEFVSTTGQAGISPDVPTQTDGTYSEFGGQVVMYWNLFQDEGEIEISLVEQGTGWVAFGIGNGMNQADIMMSSFSGGVTIAQDRFSTQRWINI